MSQTVQKPSQPVLMAIIEFGAYPNFAPIYEKLGYRVVIERSVRKALTTMKKERPRVIVAEFNYESDFRDRTSSLESVFSVVQTLPGTRVIVFYEAEQQHQFDRLRSRFRIDAALTYPIDAALLERSVGAA